MPTASESCVASRRAAAPTIWKYRSWWKASVKRRHHNTSRRLGGLGEVHEAVQDLHRALEAGVGLLPVLEEHDLHVGAHARRGAAVADIAHEAIGIGERIVAEGQHRALRAGLDLLHVGAPAQRLDGDDLEQML